MGSTKIDVEAFVNSSLIEQAEMDVVFMSNGGLDEADPNNKRLLEVPSSYLKGLSKFQTSFIEYNSTSYEDINVEQKLKQLAYKSNSHDDEFVRLYESANNKDDLMYDWRVRQKLIELKIIEGSTPNENAIRREFDCLKNAILHNDLNEVYKFSWQISNHDFQDFTEEEKKIVLQALQIQSEGVALAISYSVIAEYKIHFGTWEEYWKTTSGYKPGDDLEENYFLYSKTLCLQADYGDERLDMSMFPNLPTVYDEDSFYEWDFVSSLDWSKKYAPYEVDFILAVALSSFNGERTSFIDDVDTYITTHNISLEVQND